jgi:hypothetical protein
MSNVVTRQVHGVLRRLRRASFDRAKQGLSGRKAIT